MTDGRDGLGEAQRVLLSTCEGWQGLPNEDLVQMGGWVQYLQAMNGVEGRCAPGGDPGLHYLIFEHHHGLPIRE